MGAAPGTAGRAGRSVWTCGCEMESSGDARQEKMLSAPESPHAGPGGPCPGFPREEKSFGSFGVLGALQAFS